MSNISPPTTGRSWHDRLSTFHPNELGPRMNTPQPNDPTRIGFDPGSFGCHEALHMASVLMEMVDERLCQHPSVIANKEWEELAERACSALDDLYQAIGAKHL